MDKAKAVKTTRPAPDDDPQETTTDLDQETDAFDPGPASAQSGDEASPPMELTLRHQELIGALVVDPDIRAACKAAGGAVYAYAPPVRNEPDGMKSSSPFDGRMRDILFVIARPANADR